MSLSFSAADVRPVKSTDFPETKNQFAHGVCGDNISAGQPCYPNNGHRYEPADNSEEATSEVRGIAINSGTKDDDGGDTIVLQTHGLISFGTGVLTPGRQYVLLKEGLIGIFSELNQNDVIVRLGIAVSADYMRLNIQRTGLLWLGSSSSSSAGSSSSSSR